MRPLLIALLLAFSFHAHSKVEVAFVALLDDQGNVIQMEEGGRFGHVAVSYKGKWFHAHPAKGVVLTESLSDIGSVRMILESDRFSEPSDEYVKENLGRPFSFKKSWDDPDFTYCAKLLAPIFGANPLPMNFAAEVWQMIEGLPKSAVGLSPDDLFRFFQSQGFRGTPTYQPHRGITHVQQQNIHAKLVKEGH